MVDMRQFISQYLRPEDVEKNPEWVIVDAGGENGQYGVRAVLTLEQKGLKKKMNLTGHQTEQMIEIMGSFSSDLWIGKIVILTTEISDKTKQPVVRIDIEKTKQRNAPAQVQNPGV